jgi:cyclopropane fatty-acyl-phospholipid synthase-like methyltransferase
MADGVATKQPAQRRLPLLARLRQRWARGAASQPSAASAQAHASPLAPARVVLPPPDPVTIRQWLYGAGYAIPGNAEYVLELVKQFNLSPAMTMLDLSAGLGGAARTIAEAFNTYVTGYERDPDFVERANAAMEAHGLSRHVQISVFDPETYELRSGFYDHALAREATYCVTQKERFLRVINQSLKPFGQLVLTDFVLDRAAGDRPELAAWVGLQKRKPQLWTLAQYTDCFKSLGFDLRIANDATTDYRRMMLQGWKEFINRDEIKQLRASQASTVIDEIERTIKIMAALESGALKFYYFVALGGRRRAT